MLTDNWYTSKSKKHYEYANNICCHKTKRLTQKCQSQEVITTPDTSHELYSTTPRFMEFVTSQAMSSVRKRVDKGHDDTVMSYLPLTIVTYCSRDDPDKLHYISYIFQESYSMSDLNFAKQIIICFKIETTTELTIEALQTIKRTI